MQKVADTINRGIGAERNVELEIIRWETGAYPGIHAEGSQRLIDIQTKIDTADIFIGIFWRRYGFLLPDGLSGTDHEFRIAYAKWKETGSPYIMFYFKQQPYTIATEDEWTQLGKVLKFKFDLPREVLWWPFHNNRKFADLALAHLEKYLIDREPRRITSSEVKKNVLLKLRTGSKTNPIDGAPMLFIPAGEYTQGSSKGHKDEQPERRVYLDGYYIYAWLVTVDQYRRFLNATNRTVDLPDLPNWSAGNHPIVNVKWQDAQAYCEWAGGSLPTEAQWEKASRGPDGRQYPWGDEWDRTLCRCSRIGTTDAHRTSRVDRYAAGASHYGVLDMAGNVLEWCLDLYKEDYYVTAPLRNPPGPLEEDLKLDNCRLTRVQRAGSWTMHEPLDFRCSRRAASHPEDDKLRHRVQVCQA